MDNNTFVIIVVSSLLGFFIVKYFQMKKEIARNDLDREIDMVYRSIEDVRNNLDKDVERLTKKIETLETELFVEMDRKFLSFSDALNDMDRRVDEIQYNNINKEPTLFDNA